MHDVQSAAGKVVGTDSSTVLHHTLRPLNQLVQLCTNQTTSTEALLPLNETLRFRHIMTHGSAELFVLSTVSVPSYLTPVLDID